MDDEKTPEAGDTEVRETEETGNKLEDLPEWAQKEIKSLRNENASRRTQLQETRNQLSQAKTPEDFAKLTEDFNTKLTEKDRVIAAQTHQLPTDLASRVKGNTFEEMLADAEFLAGLVKPATSETPREPQRPERLTGGLTPPEGKAEVDKRDPAAAAAEAMKNYRRY